MGFLGWQIVKTLHLNMEEFLTFTMKTFVDMILLYGS